VVRSARRNSPGPRLATVAWFSLGVAVAPSSAQESITLASVSTTGTAGNGNSLLALPASMSADGRYVAFCSIADNLADADEDTGMDVFVRDRWNGVTALLSVDSSGVIGNGTSGAPAISADGRFVAFWSLADNLVVGDTNGVSDVFVHDRDPDGNGVFDEGNGVTRRVSLDSNGVQGNAGSWPQALSADGRFVAFLSQATNLVSGDTNATIDVFVFDAATGVTTRESVDSSGSQGDGDCSRCALSADGQVVVFVSASDDLVPGDMNGQSDVFVRDRTAGSTTRVSVDSAGTEGNGISYDAVVSADGRIVVFDSRSSDLTTDDTDDYDDVFVHDRATGATTLVSVATSGAKGDYGGRMPAISADGSTVAFSSSSDNLAANDANGVEDVFVHDLVTGETTCITVNCAGVFAENASFIAALSADGSQVAFGSFARNLVVIDTRGYPNVFVRDRTISEPDASWANYGTGYPGTLGVPGLTASADPVFLTTISIDIDNSFTNWTVGLLSMGLGQTSIPTRAGGTWLVDQVFVSVVMPIAPGGSPLSGAIPGDPALCGLSIFGQVLELDAGAAHGISFTPGLELSFGH
jgi:Tol biopolymer transport system component